MAIDQLFESAKNDLDTAKEKLEAEDFDTSLAHLTNAYANVRTLLECAWRLKREAALAAQPPGENAR